MTLVCGHKPTPSTYSPGYALVQVSPTKQNKVCFVCAAIYNMYRMALGFPVGAYLASDRKHVTTWDGQSLALVVSCKPLPHTGRSRVTGDVVYAFTAEDHEGRTYYGRATPGGHCTLRIKKHKLQKPRVQAPPALQLLPGGKR